MLICIFARIMMGHMTLPIPAGAGIGDEQVSDSAPLVRALVVQRLETIWRTCQPHIEVPLDEDGEPRWKADPRFIEAGIRVVDRLSRLYRLDYPQSGTTEPDAESRVDQRELAKAQILALTQRMTEPER